MGAKPHRGNTHLRRSNLCCQTYTGTDANRYTTSTTLSLHSSSHSQISRWTQIHSITTQMNNKREVGRQQDGKGAGLEMLKHSLLEQIGFVTIMCDKTHVNIHT